MSGKKSSTKFTKHSPEWLIAETISYFNSNNRSVSDSTACMYLNDNGHKCAIGRYLIKYSEVIENTSVGSAIRQYPKMFPKWMLQMNPKFLIKIQVLHDDWNNWYEDGLSDKGWIKVKDLFNDNELIFSMNFEQFQEQYKQQYA